MKYRDFEARMDWARKLTKPACLYCTEPFEPTEPAIAIGIDRGAHTVYFHGACYDQVLDSYRKAQKVFREMVLGFRDWSTGIIEIERTALFRSFLPSELRYGGEDD